MSININAIVLAETRAALAALDLAGENDEIALIEAEIDRCNAAIAAGNARRAEISDLMYAKQPLDQERIEARRVADAMLADVSPRQAANVLPPDDELKRESAALRAAISELRERINEAKHRQGLVRNAAAAKVALLTSDLVSALSSEAKAAAESLVKLYAALTAISEATRSGGSDAAKVSQALAGIFGFSDGLYTDGLLPAQSAIDVPVEIVRALAALADKGPALPPRLIARANFTPPAPSILPMIALEAAAARAH
jgi:hypothetical protein